MSWYLHVLLFYPVQYATCQRAVFLQDTQIARCKTCFLLARFMARNTRLKNNCIYLFLLQYFFSNYIIKLAFTGRLIHDDKMAKRTSKLTLAADATQLNMYLLVNLTSSDSSPESIEFHIHIKTSSLGHDVRPFYSPKQTYIKY